MLNKSLAFLLLGCSGPAFCAAPPANASAQQTIDPGFIQLMGGFGAEAPQPVLHDRNTSDESEFRYGDGSRLIVKHVDAQRGPVAVQILVGHGRFGLPAKLARSSWTLPLLPMGGTSAASVKEIEGWLAASGHAAQFNVVPMTHAFALIGQSSPGDIGYELAAMCGVARNPGFGDELGARLRQAAVEFPTHIESNAGLVFSRAVQRFAVGAGAQYSELPVRSEFSADPLSDLSQIVDREFGGPFDIAVVGDVDPAQIAGFVQRTCAAGRGASSARVRTQVRLQFQGGSRVVTFEHTSVSATDGYEGIFWPTARLFPDDAQSVALDVLGDVLKVRLSMRLSSSARRIVPVVGGGSIDDFPAGGYFGVGTERIDLKGSGIASIVGAELAAISQDPHLTGEVNAVRTVDLKSWRAKQDSNAAWAGTLAMSLSDPSVLARFLRREHALDHLRSEEVSNLALKLYREHSSLIVSVVPSE